MQELRDNPHSSLFKERCSFEIFARNLELREDLREHVSTRLIVELIQIDYGTFELYLLTLEEFVEKYDIHFDRNMGPLVHKFIKITNPKLQERLNYRLPLRNICYTSKGLNNICSILTGLNDILYFILRHL